MASRYIEYIYIRILHYIYFGIYIYILFLHMYDCLGDIPNTVANRFDCLGTIKMKKTNVKGKELVYCIV